MTTGTEHPEGAEIQNHSEGLKTLRIELENFKNIDKKIVDVAGKSLVILGKNGSGKSSIIQAITSSIDTKQLPTQPIKNGEEHARISHTMGGMMKGIYEEYTIDIIFSPKNKKGRLIVYDKDGNQLKTPATIIKSMVGPVSIDPIKWLHDKKEVKLRTIKELTGCGKEVDMINIDIDNLKSQLKTKNDRADDLQATIQNNGMTPEEIDKYSEPVDITTIQNELNQVSGNQQKWDEFKNKVAMLHRDVLDSVNKTNAALEETNRANAEIARYQAILAAQEKIITDQKEICDKAKYNIQVGEEWLNKTPRPIIDEVNARLTIANDHNQKSERIKFVGSQQREMMTRRSEAEVLKEDIKKLETKRAGVIQKSQLPISNMSFTDEDILINGLPLEDGQINTAEIIDISVEVAIALNPKFKVIFLHEGALFDREHLKAIVKRIEDRGYIAIIELVTETEGLEIEFTENYL